MFHHFYSQSHPAGQGAINVEQFEKIICWLDEKFKILSPIDYISKHLKRELKDDEICLTFDDSLLCQYDVALPVLQEYNLTAFFNVYSSAFSGNPDPLEVYRYFRTVTFPEIDIFYEAFFESAKKNFADLYLTGQSKFKANLDYLSEYPFYSRSDKLFRFFRDETLGRANYCRIMDMLIEETNFDRNDVPKKVFMTRDNLKELSSLGHQVGLHSDTHPTDIAKLSKTEQEKEYFTNYDFIVNELGMAPISMAHPCGKYNDETLNVLNSLDVQIGFASNMHPKKTDLKLAVPRQDHMNILELVNAN